MGGVKFNPFILGAVALLFLAATWLLHLFWTLPYEKIATSWMIHGEVTDYSSKQAFIYKMIMIYGFMLAMFLTFSFYALYTDKDYITFFARYGSYRIKRENVPNFVGSLFIIILATLDMYLYDVLTFNTSRTFFFFTFPFLVIYVILALVLFTIAILRYWRD